MSDGPTTADRQAIAIMSVLISAPHLQELSAEDQNLAYQLVSENDDKLDSAMLALALGKTARFALRELAALGGLVNELVEMIRTLAPEAFEQVGLEELVGRPKISEAEWLQEFALELERDTL